MKTNKNISFEEIGRELPFRVPDSYFEQFANQIDKKIGYNAPRTHKIFRPWMYAVAAVFVGLMVLTPVFYNTSTQSNMAKNADNYETYVLSQVDESALLDCYVDNNSAK
jgi:hypothetical protein